MADCKECAASFRVAPSFLHAGETRGLYPSFLFEISNSLLIYNFSYKSNAHSLVNNLESAGY